ncbi:hypothetical protein [Siminovitchia sp. 179-K 8D1 HS]
MTYWRWVMVWSLYVGAFFARISKEIIWQRA